MGKPGFPNPLPVGGVSRSYQRLGHGETRFLQPPPFVVVRRSRMDG